MGKDWDKALPPKEAFVEMCRVLKPGALAFVMSSPRQDVMWRMARLLEESGFELEQSFISHVFASGFPKAFDVASNISKRIDSYITKNIEGYSSWEGINSTTRSKTANIVEKLYLKNLIEIGSSMGLKNTVAEDVSRYLSQRKLTVSVTIVEKKLYEVHPMPEENIFFVVENADMISQPLSSSVKIAELTLREQNLILTAKLIFVPVNAQTYFTQKTQELITKVEEAQRIELGENRFWNEMDINAIIVEALNGFRHTISNQLRTILNLDTKSQTESLSAIDVIITESIKGCLTSVMESILEKKLTENWYGWKSVTGLKPALEVIFMVQKPLSEKTIVDNVLRWGTGAMNVDACRIPYQSEDDERSGQSARPNSTSKGMQFYSEEEEGDHFDGSDRSGIEGRFPANLLVSDDALNDGKITKPSGRPNVVGKKYPKEGIAHDKYNPDSVNGYPDSGQFSRYFDLDAWAKHHGFLNVPKASTGEREQGVYGIEEKETGVLEGSLDGSLHSGKISIRKNIHPTVKPVELMAYLIELGCPPDGVVLDPFLGSGTTCVAARMLGRDYIGIEISEEYHRIAVARVASAPRLTTLDRY